MEELYRELMNYVEHDVHFLHSTFVGMDDREPIVLTLPDTKFYHNVTKDHITDLLAGRLASHRYQKDELYDKSMEIYRTDPMHRRTVKLFRYQLEKMDSLDWRSIREVLPMFEAKYDVSGENVSFPVKMALLGTTKGPRLPKLIDFLGREDVYDRIDQYLLDNKYRI